MREVLSNLKLLPDLIVCDVSVIAGLETYSSSVIEHIALDGECAKIKGDLAVGNIYSFHIYSSSDRNLERGIKVTLAKSFSFVGGSQNPSTKLGPYQINADEIASKFSYLMRPSSITSKDEIMHRPVDVLGIVWKIHRMTANNTPVWVELFGKKENKGKGDIVFICVYPEDSIVDSCKRIKRGDEVLFRWTYPVYLWGRLHGFAMSIRSSVVIENKYMHSESSYSYEMPTVPCVNKGNAVYLIWCAYVHRRLAQCHLATIGVEFTCQFIANHFLMESISSFEKPVLAKLEELCDGDAGPLFAVRGGHDIDWLCSLLPEVWSCSMFRQFAENSVVFDKRGKVDRSSDLLHDQSVLGRYAVMCAATCGSKIRYETCSSPHDVLIIGMLIDACVTSSVLSIVLEDSLGQRITALVSSPVPNVTDCASEIHAWKHSRDQQPLEHATKEPNTLVVCLKNPVALVEVHPDHSEQSAEIFAIARRCDVFVRISASTSAIPEVSCDTTLRRQLQIATDSESVPSVILSRFLKLHNFPDGDSDDYDSTITAKSLFSSHVMSIRQVLMLNTTLGHVCNVILEGLVIRKEKVVSSMSSTRNHKKSRIDPTLLVVLRDEHYADTVGMYVPSSAARYFIPGFLVQVANASLKVSRNHRKTYLEFGHTSVVGIKAILTPEKINTILNAYAHIPTYKLDSNPLLSFSETEIAVPYCTLLSIMETRYRNRCLCKVVGHVTLVREFEVSVRCKECYARAEFVHIAGREILTCRKHRCTIAVSSILEVDNCCEVSWSGMVAVDDGGLEGLVYIEGGSLQNMLASCFRAWKAEEQMCDRANTTADTNISWKIHSFQQFKADVEQSVVKVGSVKYSHTSKSHLYVSHDDSLDNIVIADQDISVTTCLHLGAARAHAKTQAVALMSRFLRCCKLNVHMEFVVKVIFPKQESCSNVTSSTILLEPAPNIRKIKVQRSSTPGYVVDNVEFMSATRDSLKLRCIALREMTSTDVAIYTWNIWNSLKGK